jgi:hypothetical protein
MNIVVTAYFGPKETIDIVDLPQDLRFSETLQALLEMFGHSSGHTLYLAYTGDEEQGKLLAKIFNGRSKYSKISVYFYSQVFEDKSRGTSYLEYRLLEKFFSNFDRDSIFVKISGKYVVENIEDVILFVQRLGQPVGWKYLFQNIVECRCLALTPGFWANISPEALCDKKGYWLEHLMRDSLSVKRIFYRRPIVRGLSATAGRHVRQSLPKRILIRLLSIL